MEELKGTLTVEDLIRILEKFPGDWRVAAPLGEKGAKCSPLVGADKYWFLPSGEVKKRKPKAASARVVVLWTNGS